MVIVRITCTYVTIVRCSTMVVFYTEMLFNIINVYYIEYFYLKELRAVCLCAQKYVLTRSRRYWPDLNHICFYRKGRH